MVMMQEDDGGEEEWKRTKEAGPLGTSIAGDALLKELIAKMASSNCPGGCRECMRRVKGSLRPVANTHCIARNASILRYLDGIGRRAYHWRGPNCLDRNAIPDV